MSSANTRAGASPNPSDAAPSPGGVHAGLAPGAESPQPGGRHDTRIETRGIEVVPETDRHGRARDQFWPWAGGNLTILGISMGAILLTMGLSLWQGLLIATVGVALSFLVIGVEALSGQRGNAPTLVLSRAAFGMRGNLFSGVVGYLLMVGWETVGVSLSVMAGRTITHALHVHSAWVDAGVFTFVVGCAVTLAVFGFHLIMRVQRYVTLAVLLMTVAFIAMTWRHVHWSALHLGHAGPFSAVVGGFVTVLSSFGIGWATAGGDYSRYLPRSASRAGVVAFSTLGGTTPVALLMVYGLLLAASNPSLQDGVAGDPIGVLTTMLPTWFLVPFLVVVVVGLMAGLPMDVYSSGLTLLAMGVPVRRWTAACIDGVMMTLGAVYVIWIAPNFLSPFESFLYTLGVALSAWTGIYIADMVLRWRVGYDADRLHDGSARGYGSVNWAALAIALLSTVVGMGLITSSLSWLRWEGFLLGPLGLGGRHGEWAEASSGVLVALLLSGLLYALWWRVTRHEA